MHFQLEFQQFLDLQYNHIKIQWMNSLKKSFKITEIKTKTLA